MRTGTDTKNKSSRGGCGCGGGCESCRGGGGSCGTAVATTQDAAYVRPRFFAGQLLTDDDLAALVDYTVAKNRLHNSRLFGAGVVCGLQVMCDPCKPGGVRVQPGYALDCCGNDIVVPCPESLDILAMVRRMRAEKGLDCGDPCSPAATKPTKPTGDTPNDDVAADRQDTPKVAPRRYCLWVRYQEKQSEPVAPYVIDRECGSCEATRVEESYSFELRCPTEPPPPIDIVSRIVGCIGDFVETRTRLSQASTLGLASNRMRDAAEAIAVAPDSHYRIVDAAGYRREVDDLADRVDSGLAKMRSGQTMSSDEAIAALDDVGALAGQKVRYDVHGDAEREAIGLDTQRVSLLLQEAVSSYDTGWRARTITTPLEQAEGAATIELTDQWAGAHAPPVDDAGRDVRLASYEARLMIHGVALTPALFAAYGRALEDLRQSLVASLEVHGLTGNCGLLRELEAIRIPHAAAGNQVEPGEVARLTLAIRDVIEVLLQYLLECFCAALLPPCPPCDEDAVLLACLDLEDCAVVSICNLERNYVLTSTNMQYWLGPLRVVKHLLERVCCELPRRISESRKERIVQGAPRAESNMRYAYARAAPPLGGVTTMSLLDGGFDGASIPDLLGGVLQQYYGSRAGKPIRFAEFELAAGDLWRVVTARAGETTRVRPRTDGKLGGDGATLVKALEEPQVRAHFDRHVASGVERVVREGRVDLGDTIARAADGAIVRLRNERDAALRTAIAKWSTAEDGLTVSVTPIVREAVDKQVVAMRERAAETVKRLVQDQGLEPEALAKRIATSIDAKLAETGLNAASLNARLDAAIAAALSANGLTQRVLNDRLEDTVGRNLEALGLDAAALTGRIRNQVDAQLGAVGLAPSALAERIDAEVSKALAREALTTEALDTRVRTLVAASGNDVATEVNKARRAIETKFARETKDLQAKLGELTTELKALRKRLGEG
jgi:hypothetical protein